jgi:hypothetical protein
MDSVCEQENGLAVQVIACDFKEESLADSIRQTLGRSFNELAKYVHFNRHQRPSP